MAVKVKKVPSKPLTKETKHVGTWLRGHASWQTEGTQGILAREHLRSQATITREHESTQDMSARERVST